LAAVATLTLKPSLKLGDRVEPELAAVDAFDVRLDVALEVAQAHPERGGGVGAAEREHSPI
jgi:hypothetical protein